MRRMGIPLGQTLKRGTLRFNKKPPNFPLAVQDQFTDRVVGDAIIGTDLKNGDWTLCDQLDDELIKAAETSCQLARVDIRIPRQCLYGKSNSNCMFQLANHAITHNA